MPTGIQRLIDGILKLSRILTPAQSVSNLPQHFFTTTPPHRQREEAGRVGTAAGPKSANSPRSANITSGAAMPLTALSHQRAEEPNTPQPELRFTVDAAPHVPSDAPGGLQREDARRTGPTLSARCRVTNAQRGDAPAAGRLTLRVTTAPGRTPICQYVDLSLRGAQLLVSSSISLLNSFIIT